MKILILFYQVALRCPFYWYCNFRPCPEPERQSYIADANIYVQSPLAFVVHSSPFRIDKFGKGVSEQDALHGVGMSCKHQ